jgi:hypothetical protein
VGAYQFFDKFADLPRPDHVIKPLVNFLIDGDGQLFLHGTTPHVSEYPVDLERHGKLDVDPLRVPSSRSAPTSGIPRP